MRIGIGLPTVIPGVAGAEVLEWARRAEARGFATLGVIDRIAYVNYEPLTALAVAAGATRTIGLMTDVLLGPTRDPVLLAKQAASLALLSGGRLTLGLGVGARPDDFAVTGRDFHARGRDWDAALATMDAAWRGDPPPGTTRTSVPGAGGAGRPRLLFGGTSDATFRRIVRWGQGWTASSSAGDALPGLIARARSAWREAGRPGEPWISVLTYFGAADDPDDRRAAVFLADYYGPQRGPALAATVARTPEAMRAMVRRYEDLGADEVVAFPTLPGADQVDRLADAVLG